jgi:hypothetical protein
VRFTWTNVVDAAGGPVTYRHCVWSAARVFDFDTCTAVAEPSSPTTRGVAYAGSMTFLLLLLFLVLFSTGLKQRRALLILVAIAILPAALLAFYIGRTMSGTTAVVSTAARLEPSGVYFWKVIAEDREGGGVESETRRFTVR